MQKEMFGNELKALKEKRKIKSVHRKLNLFLDQNDIIRCKGRLGNLLEGKAEDTPVLVDGGHPVVRALIAHYHRHYNC